MDQYPIQGVVEILLVANQDKRWPPGSLGLYGDFGCVPLG